MLLLIFHRAAGFSQQLLSDLIKFALAAAHFAPVGLKAMLVPPQ
jgi:hypothetical protein